MEYVKTYIKGLDEKVKGGIPADSIILVAGPTGGMKSSLSFYMAFNHLKNVKKGKVVYISLEQSRDSLLRQMKSLGMDLAELPNGCEFTIFDWGYFRKLIRGEPEYSDMDWINTILSPVEEYTKDERAEFIILDSINALDAIANMVNPRNQLFFLFEDIKKLGKTAIVVSETSYDSKKLGTYDVEGFLSDAVIHLSMEKVGRTLGRYVSLIKIRGVKHPTDYFPMIVDKEGFRIVAP
jgi:KaiC/GvpD/RAD55 family RecA-like ATPase